MIRAHITDSRGVYLFTTQVDPMGGQPSGAIYKDVPEYSEGYFLIWSGEDWNIVSEEDLPQFEDVASPRIATQEVTMAQCRLALFDKHKIETDDEFYGLVDTLPEEMRVRARLELRTRPTVRYDNPLVIAFCEAKGWNRDELFVYADTL